MDGSILMILGAQNHISKNYEITRTRNVRIMPANQSFLSDNNIDSPITMKEAPIDQVKFITSSNNICPKKADNSIFAAVFMTIVQ